jgi:hypothetical protein
MSSSHPKTFRNISLSMTSGSAGSSAISMVLVGRFRMRTRAAGKSVFVMISVSGFLDHALLLNNSFRFTSRIEGDTLISMLFEDIVYHVEERESETLLVTPPSASQYSPLCPDSRPLSDETWCALVAPHGRTEFSP